jgi:hypothetical protein
MLDLNQLIPANAGWDLQGANSITTTAGLLAPDCTMGQDMPSC